MKPTPAQLVARYRELKRLYPLAFAQLWEPTCSACGGALEHVAGLSYRCEPCNILETRTSQRRAIARLFDPSVQRGFLLGGNRTGKSEGCAQVAVAVALGRNSQQVQLWGKRNGLDISWIQPGPGRVWAVALDSQDSRRYVRPKVAGYLPHGSKWRNRDGPGESEVSIPTVNGTGAIVFKNCDQGRDGFQGSAVHMVWADEEPSLPVITECDFRLIDYDHRGSDPSLGVTKMLFSMTPLQGWTPLLRHNFRGSPTAATGEPLAGVARVHLDGLDNPHIDRAALEARLSRVAAHEREARKRGEITALEGRIYTDFDPGVHVVEPFEIPKDWPRYQAIDFGYTHPFCALWGALDGDGRLYIYREHYRAGWLLRKHALAITEAESCPHCFDPDGYGSETDAEVWWERYDRGCSHCDQGRAEPEPDIRWADPENAGDRRSLSADYRIVNSPARKRVAPGIRDVAERLVVQPDGKPRLYVFNTCTNLLSEFPQYRWKPNRGSEEIEPKPLKTNDHAMDALRYMIRGIAVSVL